MFTHTDDSATYSILLELQLATVIALSRLQSYQFGYFCSCNSPFQKNVWLFPYTQNPNGVRITLLLASAPHWQQGFYASTLFSSWNRLFLLPLVHSLEKHVDTWIWWMSCLSKLSPDTPPKMDITWRLVCLSE